MSFCSWCDKEFYGTSNRQIYCSPECRQDSSRQKIIESYHIKKRKKRVGKEKLCSGGCNTILSIYNDSGICDNCLENKKRFNKFVKELKEYFDYERE